MYTISAKRGVLMKKSGKLKTIVKRILITIVSVMLIAVIAVGIVLYGRIATIMSAKQVGEQLYTVNYKQSYHLDKALEANITSEKELFNFICDEFYFGYDVDSNVQEFACSAFLTETLDGKRLVGRNFDFSETETLSVYTHPKDGYASYSTVDLDVMAVGAPNDTEVMSLTGKLAMLAAPYLCVDGMNEKGLSVSLLDLPTEETHENTEKPDLLIIIAVRMLLDRAASVDEAIDMLSQYDIHTVESVTQHIFAADKSGRAVVIEWHKGEMKVVESNVCTNFRLSAKSLDGDFSGQCDRFDTITELLSKSPQNSPNEAMDILNVASVTWTQWSCVYHLDDFSVDIVTNNDFKNIYKLSNESY